LGFRRLPISGKNPAVFSTVEQPLFCYITDRKQLAGLTLTDCISRAIEWGVDLVQIREKDLSDRALFELTRTVLALAMGTPCRVLVNGRIDIARAAGAHGVHLPSTGPDMRDFSPGLMSEMIVGISAHSQRDVRSAQIQGAHYILLGPVFPTKSKLRYGPPMGLRRFHRICRSSTIAVLGLGGIHPETISPVLSAGAVGIAGISIFQKEIGRLAARSSF
jgi:thiamine-phosphate pyrophosphorylase